MASAVREKIKLVSTGTNKSGRRTGYYKTTTKNKRNSEKLSKNCFDPFAYNPETGKCGMHVLFKEDKIK